jgi:hypothetical protein
MTGCPGGIQQSEAFTLESVPDPRPPGEARISNRTPPADDERARTGPSERAGEDRRLGDLGDDEVEDDFDREADG